MAGLIRLESIGRHSDLPALMTLRLMTGLDPEEFAAAVSDEAGEPVPTFAYLAWEGGEVTPREIHAAAHRVAVRGQPTGREPGKRSRATRRDFLGGVVGVALLSAAGLPADAFALGLGAGRGGTHWRVSPETAHDLESLVEDYRQSYATGGSAEDQLRGARALLALLVDLARRDLWPSTAVSVSSLAGQIAVLTGLLEVMGSRNLPAAGSCYRLAIEAAREADDWDLQSYVLGSLAFHAVSDARLADGRAIVDAAWQLASAKAAPRTRAWVACLASELYAREGLDAASRRLLDAARREFTGTLSMPSWKGVGLFDEAKLTAYEGGNLLLLHRNADAERPLRVAVQRLPLSRTKHRSTALGDLAMALAGRRAIELEEVCAHASQALDLALEIRHRESVERVAGVHFRLLRWRTHASVRDLGERLRAVPRFDS
jgi:hypothetical protein